PPRYPYDDEIRGADAGGHGGVGPCIPRHLSFINETDSDRNKPDSLCSLQRDRLFCLEQMLSFLVLFLYNQSMRTCALAFVISPPTFGGILMREEGALWPSHYPVSFPAKAA